MIRLLRAGQGEQLKHIRKEQQQIADNLSTADKLLTSLESWRGAARTAVSSWFGGSRPASARGAKKEGQPTPAPPPPATTQKASCGGGTNPFAGSRQQQQQQGTVEPGAADDAMGQIANLVEGLHAQALEMNTAIKDQSTLLDETIDSADSQQSRLDKNNRRARKLIGR